MHLVNYLVSRRGADVEIKDDGGTTALHCAALKGHDNIIKLLFLKDADVNAMGDEGTTPLDAAIEGGAT
jgi:ankyrin repeat protein